MIPSYYLLCVAIPCNLFVLCYKIIMVRRSHKLEHVKIKGDEEVTYWESLIQELVIEDM